MWKSIGTSTGLVGFMIMILCFDACGIATPLATPSARSLTPSPEVSTSPDALASLPAPSPTTAPTNESACAVTTANGKRPPSWTESGVYHGNGLLFTQLWPDGIVYARSGDLQADGSIAVKFPWWRGVAGRLEISGRRLDGESRALSAWIPDGYGDVGFQSTAVIFPVPGCWEVTGSVQKTSLTFVIRVVAP